MDIANATAVATAIAGALAPFIIQFSKQHIPSGWTELYSLGVSLLLSIIALVATNGFSNSSWAMVIPATIGISQTVYSIINKTGDNSLSKSAQSDTKSD